MRIYSAIVLAGLTLAAPWAAGQRFGHAATAGRISGAVHPPAGSLGLARGGRLSARFRQAEAWTAFASPFFSDFDENEPAGDFAPETSRVPAFLMGGSPEPYSASGFGAPLDYGRRSSSAEPLLIELQGDRYVRVRNAASDRDGLAAVEDAESGDRGTKLPNAGGVHAGKGAASALPTPNPAPAVLVFRDGHSQEVSDYTIAGGFLYARGDFYRDGYWNQKIDLASLDVPQTLRENSRRNVKFSLPSSPNEVIARF